MDRTLKCQKEQKQKVNMFEYLLSGRQCYLDKETGRKFNGFTHPNLQDGIKQVFKSSYKLVIKIISKNHPFKIYPTPD